MNETFANYLAANPAMGGDPATLNLPSLRANSCNGICEFTRTLCSALDVESSWAINPSTPTGFAVSVSADDFTLLADGVLSKLGFEASDKADSECTTLTVIVTINDMALVTAGELIFDVISFTEHSALSPDLKWTVSFLPTGIAP
jgi:hypothetical protein